MIKETYGKPPEILTREPTIDDEARLREILTLSVVDSESGAPIESEIKEILARVRDSVTGDGPEERRYLVAESGDGTVLGMMGLTRPDDEMSAFSNRPEESVELINAFVDPTVRGSGAGRKLVEGLLAQASSVGVTEVVVNSGPRYRETGWAFWSKMFGEPTVLANRYGPGADAMVWRADVEPKV